MQLPVLCGQRTAFALSLMLSMFPATGTPVAAQDASQLDVGVPVERELSGDQTHVYLLKVAVNDYVSAVVEQRGIDVVVTVVGPDGAKLLEVDSPNGTNGPEPVALVAERAGEYRVEVRSLEAKAPPGRYEIRLAAIRPATDGDRLEAEMAGLEARISARRAARKLEEAIPLAERIVALSEQAYGKQDVRVAKALESLGLIYGSMGRMAETGPIFERALAVTAEALGPDAFETGRAALRFGNRFARAQLGARAEDFFRRGLPIVERITLPEDAFGTGFLNDVAMILEQVDRAADARANYLRSIALFEKLGGPANPRLASPLHNLGFFYMKTGELAKAEEAVLRALEVRRKREPVNNSDVESELGLLGQIALKQGDLAKAASYHREALALAEATAGPRSGRVAAMLINDSEVSFRSGDYERAEAQLTRAGEIYDRNPRITGYQIVLNNLLHCRWARGNLDGALAALSEYAESVEMRAAGNDVGGSQRARANYLRGQSPDRFVAYSPDGMPGDARAARLALTVVFRLKGRLLDVEAETIAALRRSGSGGQPVLDELAALRAEIARRKLEGARGRADEVRRIEQRIADPDFQAAAAPASAPASEERTRAVNLANPNFAPLPGTDEEARAVRRLIPGSVVLTRERATKAALERARAPRLLHVATHGVFVPDAPADAKATRIEDPLLRSGLALAGANRREPSRGDGILTALEVSGLDLWGTQPVVLSACDTGVGDIRNGEGVYGLRRALVLAGSETQVLSLWDVDDLATRDLMKSYYGALLAGQGRAEALRSVQLKMLSSSRRKHPSYWAGFIVSSDWRPLLQRRIP